MRSRKVGRILVPCSVDLPVAPSISIDGKITEAIELMLRHAVSRLAVTKNQRTVGMIRLEDAFREIGLEMPER